MLDFLENHILNNWKMKSYALGVSLVLWFVILGQRSIVVTRVVSVEYLVAEGSIVQDSVDKISLTISAKRSALQSFNAQNYAPVVDLRGLPPGAKRIPLKADSIQMPLGAKLLNIEPKVVTLYLKNESKPLTNEALNKSGVSGSGKTSYEE